MMNRGGERSRFFGGGIVPASVLVVVVGKFHRCPYGFSGTGRRSLGLWGHDQGQGQGFHMFYMFQTRRGYHLVSALSDGGGCRHVGPLGQRDAFFSPGKGLSQLLHVVHVRPLPHAETGRHAPDQQPKKRSRNAQKKDSRNARWGKGAKDQLKMGRMNVLYPIAPLRKGKQQVQSRCAGFEGRGQEQRGLGSGNLAGEGRGAAALVRGQRWRAMQERRR